MNKVKTLCIISSNYKTYFNDEKNTVRSVMLLQGSRKNVERYRKKWTQQTHLFKIKQAPLGEGAQ